MKEDKWPLALAGGIRPSSFVALVTQLERVPRRAGRGNERRISSATAQYNRRRSIVGNALSRNMEWGPGRLRERRVARLPR